MTARLDRLAAAGGRIAAGFDETGLAFSFGLGRTPAGCPYQPGDWVRGHGYPNSARGDRFGFRGYVLGGMGATCLRGMTDDGREWFASYGHLTPDVPLARADVWCVCCPDERLRERLARPVDLLDLLAASGGGTR